MGRKKSRDCHPEPWRSHGEGPYDLLSHDAVEKSTQAAEASKVPGDRIGTPRLRWVPHAGFAAAQDDIPYW